MLQKGEHASFILCPQIPLLSSHSKVEFTFLVPEVELNSVICFYGSSE
jgi:hypothetical protein